MIDSLAALIILYFFIVGLNDGSVSLFNGRLWFTVFFAITVIIAGGWFLKEGGNTGFANLLLAVLAIPFLLYAFFLLVVAISGERWN